MRPLVWPLHFPIETAIVFSNSHAPSVKHRCTIADYLVPGALNAANHRGDKRANTRLAIGPGRHSRQALRQAPIQPKPLPIQIYSLKNTRRRLNSSGKTASKMLPS
jgi:hypothetical protein